jgi:hypothetical protein
MTTTFIVGRKNLRETGWLDMPEGPLPPGGARLRIELFALTANNITYAAFGDAMSYWRFFPTPDPGTGCIPVWGFATVAESNCDGVSVGERFYGYFPMADSVVLQPGRVGPAGFVDEAPHRRELSAVYNHYLRCSADPLHDPAHEGELAVLRPLFTTSFLIDDFLADNAFFGAGTVILSSASSKTAYGTAFCLARRRGTPHAVRIVGLTSAANAGYARSLGCYDDVRLYDEVGALDGQAPTVYVDMSGSVTVRAAVHAHFGDRLRYSCSVGGTHWDDLGSGKGLPGPRPVLFFAPAQSHKRLGEWGPDVFGRKLAEAWHAFMVPVTAPADPWLRVVRAHGKAAVEAAYRAQLDGTVPAREGCVLAV